MGCSGPALCAYLVYGYFRGALNNQEEYYQPRGESKPDSAYSRRIEAAFSSGLFVMTFINSLQINTNNMGCFN